MKNFLDLAKNQVDLPPEAAQAIEENFWDLIIKENNMSKEDSLRNAAQKLVTKLEEIHNDPKYMSVWEISQAHIGPYSGPNYINEIEELKKILYEKNGK